MFPKRERVSALLSSGIKEMKLLMEMSNKHLRTNRVPSLRNEPPVYHREFRKNSKSLWHRFL